MCYTHLFSKYCIANIIQRKSYSIIFHFTSQPASDRHYYLLFSICILNYAHNFANAR